ncbi:unnamed protein product [Paramecium pentaurelia]|uniref:Uncharacterized protein n=1 Tax=Paramecium pentaurelia TaxID=43138 RepID=A0A8S1YAN6_9CILI|nr:unnamed protein product [Paramecium pentaurelia]
MIYLGYKLYNDDRRKEAIRFFDAALFINSKHFDSLYYKCIQIIDKCISLVFNVIHYDYNLNIYKLSNYNDTLILVDKILSINSKHIDSISTKFNHSFQIQVKQYIISLQQLKLLCTIGKYEEGLKIIDQALNFIPNSYFPLYVIAYNHYKDMKKQLFIMIGLFKSIQIFQYPKMARCQILSEREKTFIDCDLSWLKIDFILLLF